jgi:hypothetical protein
MSSEVLIFRGRIRIPSFRLMILKKMGQLQQSTIFDLRFVKSRAFCIPFMDENCPPGAQTLILRGPAS